MTTEQELARKVRVATVLEQTARVVEAIVNHPNSKERMSDVKKERKEAKND